MLSLLLDYALSIAGALELPLTILATESLIFTFLNTMTLIKHFSIVALSLFMASYLWSCQGETQTSDKSDPPPGTPGEYVDKNPVLPTKYVDTTGNTYAWHKAYNQVQAIKSRIRPPAGYVRTEAAEGSFADWLRYVPLKPGKPDVMLYNGEPKGYQGAHHRVIDMDVGTRDLQQCADAVMRMRAEYLYANDAWDQISFNFTSGDACTWEKWRQGYRPKISGNNVSFSKTAKPSDSYKNFRSYMDKVFTYAGTASLAKELDKVEVSEIGIGDVFIQGGFPGHAILVMDMAENKETGEKIFLLAQSYMPAQEMHILVNPGSDDGSPWYSDKFPGNLQTPEWTFSKKDLKRF